MWTSVNSSYELMSCELLHVYHDMIQSCELNYCQWFVFRRFSKYFCSSAQQASDGLMEYHVRPRDSLLGYIIWFNIIFLH